MPAMRRYVGAMPVCEACAHPYKSAQARSLQLEKKLAFKDREVAALTLEVELVHSRCVRLRGSAFHCECSLTPCSAAPRTGHECPLRFDCACDPAALRGLWRACS